MVSSFVFVGAGVAVGGVSAAGVVAGQPREDGGLVGGAVAVLAAPRRVSRFRDTRNRSRAGLSALLPTAPINRVTPGWPQRPAKALEPYWAP